MLDPANGWKATRTPLRVADPRLDGGLIEGLNELEMVEGELWANILPLRHHKASPCVARIDVDTGRVIGWLDFSALRAKQSARARRPSGERVRRSASSERTTPAVRRRKDYRTRTLSLEPPRPDLRRDADGPWTGCNTPWPRGYSTEAATRRRPGNGDARRSRPQVRRQPHNLVLNGIAYRRPAGAARPTLLATGKQWDSMFDLDLAGSALGEAHVRAKCDLHIAPVGGRVG